MKANTTNDLNPTLFDISQYQDKQQSHLGDWSQDVTGDDPAWSDSPQKLQVSDHLSGETCLNCTHFNHTERFCQEFAIRFKPGESLFSSNDCAHLDTESIPATSGVVDSVTPPHIPVTESKWEESSGESVSSPTNNDSVTPIGCVSISKSGGTARGDRAYYRYSFRDAGKIRHIHIPGGNINSPVAQRHREQVERAIAQRSSLNEILTLISNGSRYKK